MRNIKLTIEYDGTNYVGWQTQNGHPTVQTTVVEAIKTFIGMGGSELKLIGASRTDSGVHAVGQVANFVTSSNVPLKGIMFGLNVILPEDIVIKAAEDVSLSFDSRKDAKAKTYLYRVFNKAFRTPIFRGKCWVVKYALDCEVMKSAAGVFIGKKDFSSFRAADSDAEHSVREILSFTVEKKEDGFIDMEVKGSAFLRHMVRIMVGAVVSSGLGKIQPGDITKIIEARDRRCAPETAPAEGLFLKEVEY